MKKWLVSIGRDVARPHTGDQPVHDSRRVSIGRDVARPHTRSLTTCWFCPVSIGRDVARPHTLGCAVVNIRRKFQSAAT